MKKVGIILLICFLLCFVLACFTYYILENITINTSNLFLEEDEDNIQNNIYYSSWSISIPKINLKNVNIEEGISKEVLDRSVGHFPNTNITDGNVCLAGHNRGEKVEYFARIDELMKGDEIIYNTFYETKKFSVEEIKQIDAYDWSELEDKNENRLTLITCIKDSPNLRLCVIAKEV